MQNCLGEKVQENKVIHRRNFFPSCFLEVKIELKNLSTRGFCDVGGICSNGIFEVLCLIQEGYSFVFFLLLRFSFLFDRDM